MSRQRKDEAVFKALANRRRREILDQLKNRPLTTGEICDLFPGADRCTVMLHLRVLVNAGLVISKREGRLRWNYLNVLPIKQIYDRWISRYAEPSVNLLARLKRDLESM
ncbi:helix-turn-helix domain-containing protein [bacterium]|nr:helix-turn-helix domain-containing protein [bacterium]MCI0603256.1 helix-turn-helix domain-containing protein [bacterium]